MKVIELSKNLAIGVVLLSLVVDLLIFSAAAFVIYRAPDRVRVVRVDGLECASVSSGSGETLFIVTRCKRK